MSDKRRRTTIGQELERLQATTEVQTRENLSEDEILSQHFKEKSVSVTDFLNYIEETAKRPGITTGFPILDDALGGNGFYEGVFVIGAPSSLGKSAFAIEIMNRTATAGNSVLFYSLEMSRNEIIARSISRLTTNTSMRDGRSCKKSTSDILGGKWLHLEDEQEYIEELFHKYQSEIKDKIFITEYSDSINIKTIDKDIEKYIKFSNQKPLVTIDYLQILPAPYQTNNYTEKQIVDKNMTLINQLSRKHGIPIVVISSFNREGYFKPPSLTSFKESGGIEYSADVVIGLKRRPISGGNIENQADLDRVMEEEARTGIRNIEAILLKNRNGIPSRKIKYTYTPQTNSIEEENDLIFPKDSRVSKKKGR